MRNIKDKVALVTGAASGIGRDTARALAKAGARLILCDVDEEGLRSVERNVAVISDCLLAQRVDVSSRAEMEAFAGRIHRRVSAVDILVNNAGVGLTGGIVDTSLDDWEWILGVNLWGVIHGCHFFIPPMLERGDGGHVVNVSSALGYFAAPQTLGYATSKFAVYGLSEGLRVDHALDGIEVSTICPGIIDTGIIKRTRFRGFEDAEGARDRVQRTYHKRNYGPEKVAKAIVKSIRRGGGVVPVSPEAWGFYYLKRFLPVLGDPLARAIARRTMG